jgi:hypothetical protein
VAGSALLALLGTGCFHTARSTPVAVVASPSAPAASAAPALGAPLYPLNFDPTIFGEESATITNPWWPIKSGHQWIWEGHALDGEDVIKRKLIFTATGLTKRIAGVQTMVGWDRDYDNGKLVESEMIFLAQDKAGNIWHFGQSLERYDEEGHLDGSETWLVGYLAGAKAGILMKANPETATQKYSEGFAPPPYFWNDVARVTKTGQKNCVKAGCYTGAIVIEESEPSKPNAFQYKYWVKGVGNIRTDWGGKAELEKEELELIAKRVLSAKELADAQKAVLTIEAHQRVYGITEPIKALS